MRIKRLDVVDWEPAVLLFTFEEGSAPKPTSFRSRAETWLKKRATTGVCSCSLRYFELEQTQPNCLTLRSEWMCSACCQALADFCEKTFPDLTKVELGHRVSKTQNDLAFIDVPKKTIQLEDGRHVCVEAFSISKMPMSVGHFDDFTKASGYVTTAEREKHWEVFRENQSVGRPSRKARYQIAACYLSYEDAMAYCHRGNCRLPTEEEWLAAVIQDWR